MATTATSIKKDLAAIADPQKAELLQRFFKTGKGDYGEGDIFIGIVVPKQREVAKRHRDAPLIEVVALLRSPVHEHRLTALLILIEKYKNADNALRAKIIRVYLNNTKYINNWDLVDLSSHAILGHWLLDKDRKRLDTLAKSALLWERRIAVVSTFAFIHEKQFDDALRIAKTLLMDEHDLMHKATGWMLREIGKRDEKTLTDFLDRHHKRMPRTALRYAIERLSPAQKKRYMAR